MYTEYEALLLMRLDVAMTRIAFTENQNDILKAHLIAAEARISNLVSKLDSNNRACIN